MKTENPIILVADNSCPSGKKLDRLVREAHNLQSVLKEFDHKDATQVLTMQPPADLMECNMDLDQDFFQGHDSDPENMKIVMMTTYSLEPDNQLCTYLGGHYFMAVSEEVELLQFRISEIHLN